MIKSAWKRWTAVGALGVALAACEEVEERQARFEELTEAVMDQVNNEVLGGIENPMEMVSLEARALAGVQTAPLQLEPVDLEAALRTESFFVVGAVIAKPWEEVVVSPESTTLVGVQSASRASAPQRAQLGRSLQSSGQLQALEATEAPHSNEADGADDGAESAEFAIEAPEALRAGPPKPPEPISRALRIRKEVNAPAARRARSKAAEALERMGLAGAVSTSDGGQVVIQIGADPLKFSPEKARDAMRARFAPARRAKADLCEGDVTVEQMRSDPILATECVVKVLADSGEYEYVEKDYIFTHQLEPRQADMPVATPTALAEPNDPLWSLQWHFQDIGTGEGASEGGAGFHDFWSRAEQTGSRAVTVAVIDTGLQLSHPDIAGSQNLAPGFDMVSDPIMGNDGDGRDPDPNDPGDKCDPNDPLARDTFHGTHVAGTVGVAATNNANGVAGGAWDVTIVPVRALGRCGGQLSDINDGIRWAAGVVPARDAMGEEIWNANPADVINLSIGLFERCPASMQEAINDAVEAGAVVVAAAGNARIDTQYYAPGGCDNVISVAAGDARGHLTPYSNYGAAVDILAPGGDMSRDDNGDGRPDGVLSTKFATDCYDPVSGDGVTECFYAYENGTSMAAPHVSAALALLKASFPTAEPSELTRRLLD
ncbi:MAG: S8 family serine peptidase, partial [Pseudomonadota bacterium]